MKQCPTCNRTYSDETQNYCLEDGANLVSAFDSEATQRRPLQPTMPSTPFGVPRSTPIQTPQGRPGLNPWFILLGVLGLGAVLFLVALVALAPKIKGLLFAPSALSVTPTPTPTGAYSPTPTQSPTPASKPEPSPSRTSYPSPQPTLPQPVDLVPGRYPEASTRYLSESDLAYKNCFDLKIMRNEVYARHGYIFKTPDMVDYFTRQSWYRPSATTVDVINSFSPIEKRNVQLIKANEDSMHCS
jgi:serine/threonine-protein kinase